MYYEYFYYSTRPSLTIESMGGHSLGRCYTSHNYKITSLRRLDSKKIFALREAGFLGYGQEFQICSQCDGKEDPAGFDMIEVTQVDPYDNKPTGKKGSAECGFKDAKFEYFQYITETRCDSGD